MSASLQRGTGGEVPVEWLLGITRGWGIEDWWCELLWHGLQLRGMVLLVDCLVRMITVKLLCMLSHHLLLNPRVLHSLVGTLYRVVLQPCLKQLRCEG